MSLRRELAASFAVQGAGAASVLLATLWLGWRLGPEVQGGFSRAKSEIEFVAAFSMFGLPQALFFYVKSQRLGRPAALRWALASALAALALGAAYAAIEHPGASAGVWALLALAVAAAVAHGQLRALLLVHARALRFNLATALPQVLMLGGVGLALAAGLTAGTAWFAWFAGVYAVAALLARAWLGVRGEAATRDPVRWQELVRYGLAAWLTAALSTAAILATQRWIETTQGRVALGQFTMAMTLVQVPLTPIAYAAPLLLRRWMERSGAQASRRAAATVFGALMALAVAVAAASATWPDLGLGPGYSGATRGLALLLAGGAAEAWSRVLTVQASARGRPWIGVRAEVARWVVLLAGCLGASRWAVQVPGVLAACAVWALAAGAGALVFAWYARSRVGAWA